MVKRCSWVDENSTIYKDYHDHEWGKPVYDDEKLYEMFLLETFQAGLSWITILKKRESFKIAFDNFDVNKIARYDENKIEQLMENKDLRIKMGKNAKFDMQQYAPEVIWDKWENLLLKLYRG